MTKQNQNPKAIVAAATGYSTRQFSVTFYGPLGHVTLCDNGNYQIGGTADCLHSGGYKNQTILETLQTTYRRHPAISGQPLPKDVAIDTLVAINSPDGEDWGTRKVTTVTNWLGEERTVNHGYMAGGTWVHGWVD